MKTHNRKSAPVSRGDFLDGPDTLLWNPVLPEVRRRDTLRVLVTRDTVLLGMCGLGSLALAIVWATGGAMVLLFAIWVLASCSSVFALLGAVTIDHQREALSRLQKYPGELFYRTNDFADLDTSTHDTVVLLVDAVGELTTTPARGWLDPDLPREVHQVVWDTLCCLDRTRPARALAAQLAREPDEVELASAAAAAVEAIDAAVAEVVLHLVGCLTLTRAWETKLHHRDLAARTDAALADLCEIPLASVVETAESLPYRAFAHLTAARDITDVGPFPWEDLPPGRGRHHPTALDAES